MVDVIEKTFKKLNDNNIKYFILRDFSNLDRIMNSLDIDVYVNIYDKKSTNNLLKKEGWYTPFFNDNKYPHKQYYRIINNKIFKLDVVYGFYYGKENYKLSKKIINESINYDDKLEYINVAAPNFAIVTMVLHILFDKKNINEKNKNVLNDMLKRINKSNSKQELEWLYSIAKQMIENSTNITNNNINKYRKLVKKQKIIKYSIMRDIYAKLKILICKVGKITKKVFSNRSIAFIGVDGSGKSSSIQVIDEMLGSKSKIVYMGLKEFKIKKLYSMTENRNGNIFYKLLKRCIYYIEMLIRVLNVRFCTKVIIYDRYVDDFFVNSEGILNKLDILFYKYLFPKAKLKIYFHCKTETSFKRKNDIIDKTHFIKMKKKYDNYYLSNKKYKCIDTDINDQKECIKIIGDFINKEFPSSLI